MSDAVYTVGHSTLTIDQLVHLLALHQITAVCDVRSSPFSRMNPQFNRESLKHDLEAHGIAYVFLGKELGARSTDRDMYAQGKVRYELLAATDLFHRGLCRVRDGMKSYRIALLCAEKDPLECHRFVLVARNLQGQGIEVQHILADGSLESQAQAAERLARELKLPHSDMFRTHEDVLEDAYRIQERRIAYVWEETAADDASSPRAVAG